MVTAILAVLVKVILGLAGMGIVVLVHELGHFTAARLLGIEVEAFSLGWGRPLLRKKMGGVEYRIGILPLGGYCKLKGEAEYQAAISRPGAELPRTPGTFFGAKPWRRIIVSAAGPLFNVVFAALVFMFIWGSGFEIRSLDNRIVLASDINPEEQYPADEAGLKTGDRIVEIAGRPITNYRDIQEAIAPRGDIPTRVKAERLGAVLETELVPRIDKSSGAGKLGVYYWADPVIASVKPGSPAQRGGLEKGDLIRAVNGGELPYTVALFPLLRDKPPLLTIEYLRGGIAHNETLELSYDSSGAADIGIEFETISYPVQGLPPHRAVLKGLGETWNTLTLSLRSLALLFKGIDLTQAVSGPVRITYMVGDVAAEGFGQGLREGLISMGNFLALISIALCIMNLLPIPVLDGGMIALFILEGIMRRPIKAKTIYIFQTVGAVVIFGLMIFAVFGDILFLAGRR
ncbi:MAG: RIP metalloprotease RseP [Spirochaetaceae bacterium]|jgi:regulator of sigma E protease|nr:RIP metalloprotease RseP [Spirochaetaceae bacterium]